MPGDRRGADITMSSVVDLDRFLQEYPRVSLGMVDGVWLHTICPDSGFVLDTIQAIHGGESRKDDMILACSRGYGAACMVMDHVARNIPLLRTLSMEKAEVGLYADHDLRLLVVTGANDKGRRLCLDGPDLVQISGMFWDAFCLLEGVDTSHNLLHIPRDGGEVVAYSATGRPHRLGINQSRFLKAMEGAAVASPVILAEDLFALIHDHLPDVVVVESGLMLMGGQVMAHITYSTAVGEFRIHPEHLADGNVVYAVARGGRVYKGALINAEDSTWWRTDAALPPELMALPVAPPALVAASHPPRGWFSSFLHWLLRS